MRLFALSALALLCVPLVLAAQDAPPAERTIELHLHSLGRGYMRPMRATTERIAAIEGLKNLEALGFGGDVLRYRATTLLSDDAVAAALGLKKIGIAGPRLMLAVEPRAHRAVRAEARAVLLEIARAIMAQPRPDWREKAKPLFTDADTMEKKLKLLGVDPGLLRGVNYKPSDYHITESDEYQTLRYKVWAGAAWTPAPGVGDDEDVIFEGMRDRTSEPAPGAKADERWVGLHFSRTGWVWSDTVRWADADGVKLNSVDGDRSEVQGDKLKVQLAAESMQEVLKLVVAPRLHSATPLIKDLPSGQGYEMMKRLKGERRDSKGSGFGLLGLELSWSKRASDKHYIAKLVAHDSNHPFHLHAEVDADVIYEDYKAKGGDLTKVTEVELGTALTWVVGPESGPEVFVERRKEARAAMDAIFLALGKLDAEQREKFAYGRLGAAHGLDLTGLESKHFKLEDYQVLRQAMGDVEVSVGTPMTGGRWWLLGNPQTGKIIRSDR